MTAEYGRRVASGVRAPSGGRLDRPIGGLGKLPAGVHACTVLAVTPQPRRVLVILQALGGECHTESVEWWPPCLVVGARVRARVGPGSGAYVVRDGGRFQARMHPGGAPLTDWLSTAADVYHQVTVPWAVPQLEAVEGDGLEAPFVPRICADPAAIRGRASASATDGTDPAVAGSSVDPGAGSAAPGLGDRGTGSDGSGT